MAARLSSLSLVLSSIQHLIRNSTDEESDATANSNETPLIRRLKSNLKVYRNSSILGKHSKTISRQDALISEPSMQSETLLVYLEFTRESLFLLSVLREALEALDRTDKEIEINTQPSPAPNALLSIADLGAVHGLLQFTVSLGIYPYLSPNIDKMLELRLSHVRSLEKMQVHVPDKVRSFLLYESVKVFINLFDNSVLGATALSKHLCDILAALIQICYAPRCLPYSLTFGVTSNSAATMVSPGDIGPENHRIASTQESCSDHSNEISAVQQEWCVEALQRIVRLSYQPLVIRELLALQKLSLPRQGKRSARVCSDDWVHKACGQLLSERLMDENGVQNILKAIYDITGGNNWKKCRAVAMVIATCPAQASSVEQYYSHVCPQVLSMLSSTETDIFFKVAVAALSVMLTRQKDLAMRYLVHPLVDPLSLLCSGSDSDGINGDSLAASIENLHKVTCAVEPSSPLLTVLLPYCPLLFHVWLEGSKQNVPKTSVQSNEILCQVLRTANTCELLAFLCFVSGFQPPQTEAQQTLYKRPNICIQYSAIGTLTARTLTKEEVLSRRNAEEMERMGTGIVALLNSELKQENIIGAFFLVCLQHLTSIILHQTGYTCSVAEDTLKPVSYSDQQQDDVPASSERSSALLDCEAKLPLSQTEAYTSSLVLYITASICEELSSTLLQQVSLPDLLSSISALVSCHASFCEVINGKNHVKIVASEEHEILGGPITLGIVFGLLSAILSGIVAVERQHRALLSQLQPSLNIIANSYPNEELCFLASELHVCIATLGAVWSSEVGQRAAAQVTSAREALRETVSVQCHTNKKAEDIKSSTPSEATKKDNTDHISTSRNETFESARSSTPYQLAMQEVSDPLIPVKGHGLLALTKLIATRDPESMSHSRTLLSLFTEYLKHPDSYLYLAAINGLVSLSKIPDECDYVISTLCQGYAQLNCPSAPKRDSLVNLETGQLRTHPTNSPINESMSPSKIDPSGGSTNEKLSVEVRMKLGEALVKVAWSCGELLPHYLDKITASIFSNVNDPEPLIRASSLSNLADLCAGVKLSFSRIKNEVLSCVTSILQTDREVKVRQAALLVLKLTIRSLSEDAIEVLGEALPEMYRLLKCVESRERDELTRAHAQAALGELDRVMRNFIFPRDSKELIKKISVLDFV